MGRTPDAQPGERYEEGIVLDNRSAEEEPTEEGGLRYVNGSFKGRDGTGVFDLRSGSGGITEGEHLSTDDLVHNIAETCEGVVTRSSGKVTQQDIRDQSDTPLIRRYEYTRSEGKISQVIARQYDGTGTEIQTITITINRDVNGKYDGFSMTES